MFKLKGNALILNAELPFPSLKPLDFGQSFCVFTLERNSKALRMMQGTTDRKAQQGCDSFKLLSKHSSVMLLLPAALCSVCHAGKKGINANGPSEMKRALPHSAKW